MSKFYHAGFVQSKIVQSKIDFHFAVLDTIPGIKGASLLRSPLQKEVDLLLYPRLIGNSTQDDFGLGACERFGDFDAIGEIIFQFFDVGDDEDFFKILADDIDRLNQALAPLGVLVAKTLIDDQGLQLGAGASGQDAA